MKMNTRVMTMALASAALLFAAGAACAQDGQGANRALPYDRPTQVSGIETMCSGIGLTDQDSATAADYPVTLKVVGGYGQWLGNQNVTVDRRGRQIADVHCQGPWLLMKLDPGRYHATVTVPGAAPKIVAFAVPRAGKREVIVRFPQKTAGREAPQRTASLEDSGAE
jgi:hypothetical protein